MHAEALRHRWVALVLGAALLTAGCATLAPRPGPGDILGPRAAPALRDTLSAASPPQPSSSAASTETRTQGPLRRRHSERRRGTDVALVSPEEMALRQAASAMPLPPSPPTPEGSAVADGWPGLSWTDDTAYATGPDGKKRGRGNGWGRGDANRVTAGELVEMSPEERRTFMQQAAPGLPMPGSFESAELADQFSDQFNQGMADILKTLSLAAGAELATLPPLTKVPQVAAKAERSLDELSKAAGAVDRGEFTMAGRALEKHGPRPGSAFPKATGSVADKNRLGQEVVDDILTSAGATRVTRHHARYGDVIEIRAPDGRGVRFDSNGNFIGFLEP